MTLFAPVGELTRIAKGLSSRKFHTVDATIIRPANVTAYAAGDVIYPGVPADPPGPDPAPAQVKAINFIDAFPSQGSEVLVLSATLIDFAAQPTLLDATLHLFSKPLETAPVDNEPFDPSEDDMLYYLDSISFTGASSKKIGNYTRYRTVPNSVLTAAGDSRQLSGILTTDNAYTPISNERFRIILGLLPQDLGVYS